MLSASSIVAICGPARHVVGCGVIIGCIALFSCERVWHTKGVQWGSA